MGTVRAGRPDAFERGEAVIGALAGRVDTPERVVVDGVAVVDVAHSVSGAQGCAYPPERSGGPAGEGDRPAPRGRRVAAVLSRPVRAGAGARRPGRHLAGAATLQPCPGCLPAGSSPGHPVRRRPLAAVARGRSPNRRRCPRPASWEPGADRRGAAGGIAGRVRSDQSGDRRLLFVTASTVERHLTNVFRKLDVKGRKQLPRIWSTRLTWSKPRAPDRAADVRVTRSGRRSGGRAPGDPQFDRAELAVVLVHRHLTGEPYVREALEQA